MKTLESIRKNKEVMEKTIIGEHRGVNGRVLMRVYLIKNRIGYYIVFQHYKLRNRVLMRVYLIKNRIGYYIVFQHYKLRNPYIIYPRDIELLLSSNFQERSQIATKLLSPIPSNHKKARRYLFKALGIIKAREYLNLVYS